MVKIATTAESTNERVQQHLSSSVEGKPVDFSDQTLVQITDLARVRQIYKLSATAVTKGRKPTQGNAAVVDGKQGVMDSDRVEIEVNVLGLMALRGAT